MKKNEKIIFMKKALKQAELALKNNEVPVGAIIVDEKNNIIARDYNKIEKIGCQTGHAEVQAIIKACKRLGTWRLDDCSIYVTLEPCLMCLGLIQLSRIKSLYFGATSKEFGSGLGFAKRYKLKRKGLSVWGGLLESQSVDILRRFFKSVRSNKKVEKGEK
jgi:tRNA(adenine34) deaminase